MQLYYSTLTLIFTIPVNSRGLIKIKGDVSRGRFVSGLIRDYAIAKSLSKLSTVNLVVVNLSLTIIIYLIYFPT